MPPSASGPLPTGGPDASQRLAAARQAGVDVLIAGHGPVGAALANLLGGFGVSALVIDRAPSILEQPRAISLDDDALRILQAAGAGEGAFDTVAIPYTVMRSPMMGLFGRVEQAGPKNGHPRLITFHQPTLERALRAHTRTLCSVTALGGVELQDFEETAEGVHVTLKLGETLQRLTVGYLVGADGAHSIVRRKGGFHFVGKSFEEDWVIVDAAGAPSGVDHVEFLCDPRRPTPHMPAPGGRERWEFMLRRGEPREGAADPENIVRLLAPWRPPADFQAERRAVYRFQARTADCFGRGRLYLAGDAAHVTPPFAGQGLVAGLRDAANLAWKLAWVVQGRAAPSILESYDAERRPHARAMIDLALLMGRLVTPTSPLNAMLFHGALRSLRMIPVLGPWLDQAAIKPGNRFRRGLFSRDRRSRRQLTGDCLPQAWVRSADGTIGLSDDALGARLLLIGFGRPAGSFVDAATLEAFRRAGGEIAHVRHRGQRLNLPKHELSIEDLDGTLLPGAAPYGWAAVVRPDRTVLADGPVEDAPRLMLAALALLDPPRARIARTTLGLEAA